jgi:DNA topoisomerase-1
VKLKFKAKGGMPVLKEVRDRRFRVAVERLLALPGRRLFQHRDELGNVQLVRAADCNKFLRSVTGRRISLKDFRTLVASSEVLEALAATVPLGRRQCQDAGPHRGQARGLSGAAGHPAYRMRR